MTLQRSIKIKMRGGRYRTYTIASNKPQSVRYVKGQNAENPLGLLLHPRTGETPQEVLGRLAARLNCEPRQVADRVIRMLEERQNGNY